MGIRFEMVGKLDLAKDSDKRKGFEELRFKAGEKDKSGNKRKNDFTLRTLRLTMKSQDDFFNVDIKGGLIGNEESALIKTLKKNSEGKYDKFEFKYKDREKHTSDIAEFKKCVFVNGQERHEFATEYEFSMFIHDILKSGEFKDKIFRITGELEYSEYTNPNTNITNTYTNYNVNRIYLVDESTEQLAIANVDLLITENAVDESKIENEGIFNVSGYVPQYDSKKQGDKGYFQILEYPLNCDEDKRERKFNLITSLMKVEDCELAKIGFKVNLINRVEEVEFDESMLSDEDKEYIELEIMTLSDFKDEYGSGKGGYVNKMEISGINALYKRGCIPTEIKLNDLISSYEEIKEETELDLPGSLTDDELDDTDIFA